jgi:hypothetical protein
MVGASEGQLGVTLPIAARTGQAEVPRIVAGSLQRRERAVSAFGAGPFSLDGRRVGLA